MITLWVVNGVKFAKSDFEPSWKGEIAHGVGLVTPTFIFTAFMDFDKTEE